MEGEDQIQILQNFLRRKQKRNCKEDSSSGSETEFDAGNSFNSSNTESNTGTPRSITSNDSSLLISPRSNLLWDHGFDVAKDDIGPPEQRDSEWRKFSNKGNETDDDKLIADKCTKNETQTKRLNGSDIKSEPEVQSKYFVELPDIITSSALLLECSKNTTTEHANNSDIPLQELNKMSKEYDFTETPPPLPLSSPPILNTHDVRYPDSDDNCSVNSDTNIGFQHFENILEGFSDDENKNDQDVKTPMSFHSDDEESSSAEGDISSNDDDDNSDDDNGGHCLEQDLQVIAVDSWPEQTYIPSDNLDEIEAEFENILKSLDMDTEVQNTYVERFAGRRDRYGFILSPIVEAPSPTPSSLSGYSGYSGLSCSSPDPFGMFRVSPAPNRGSRQELDLSSLNVRASDIDLLNDKTVPIYQTVQAKKVIIVPEGYGWDSGDDLLSPTSTGEWDRYDNGLSTPPVSTTGINFTQFGTHITGWKTPDVPIYEVPENDSSDTTVDDTDQSDNDSEGTMEGKSDNECESTDTKVNRKNDQAGGYSELSKEINNLQTELKKIRQTLNNRCDLEQGEREFERLLSAHTHTDDSTYDINTVPLENSLSNSFGGFNAELADINSKVDHDSDDNIYVNRVYDGNSVNSLEDNMHYRLESREARSATEDEDEFSSDSCEDAEDEYSESDNDHEQPLSSLFGVMNMPTGPESDNENETGEAQERDTISVTEMLSPRSAIILSGGMFPEDSDTTVFSSDENDSRVVTPEPNMSSYGSGIKISQYTSGDSDDQNNSNREYLESAMNPSIYQGKLARNKSNDSNNTKDEVRSLTIQSPLDFSLIDSGFDAVSMSELKKSPRIFGRYYTDMDKDILHEVQSKCETPKTELGQVDCNNVLDKNPGTASQSNRSEMEIIEDSFKNIQFSLSPRQQMVVEREDKSVDSDSELDKFVTHNGSASLSESVSEMNSKPIVQNIPVRSKIENTAVIERKLPNPQKSFKTETTTESKTVLKNNLKGRLAQNHVQRSDDAKEKSSDLDKPVKIVVANLARKDSGRAKVKRGYVHEISELFNKSVSSYKDDEKQIKHTKKEAKKHEEESLPVNILKPNENIVLDVKRYTPETFCEELEANGSLGFEVTRLQEVGSFETESETMRTFTDKSDRNEENGNWLNFSNKNSNEDIDQDLKNYTKQIAEALDNDLKLSTDYEDCTVGNNNTADRKTSQGFQKKVNKTFKENNITKMDTDSDETSTVGLNTHEHTAKTYDENKENADTLNGIGEIQRDRDDEMCKEHRSCDARLTEESNENQPKSSTQIIDTKSPSDESVNMTDIMWRIPWKTRKQREAEKLSRSKLQEAPEKPSVYLNNLISRINETNRRSTKNEPMKRQGSSENEIAPKVEALSESSEWVLNDININGSEIHPIKQKTKLKKHLDDNNTTAVHETDEFNFLDSPTSLRHDMSPEDKNDDQTDIPVQYEYARDPSEIFDDSKFEIRYPSSLSRRLYGPYSRLRGINNNSDNSDSDVSETTLDDLPSIHTKDRQSYLSTRKPLMSLVTDDGFSKQINSGKSSTKSMNKNTNENAENNSVCGETLQITNTSSTFQDREISYHNSTHINLSGRRTPLTRRSLHDGMKYNTKPITYVEVNRADQGFKKSENKFVTVTLPSDKPQSHLLKEARRDKHDYDFSQLSDYGCVNVNGESECNTAISSDKLQSRVSDCIENSREHEYTDTINDRELGGDISMVNVKNGLHQSGLGVHIPTDKPCNETRPQDVDMNDEDLSTKGKLLTVNTNLPGINYLHGPKGTYNIHTKQLMSLGKEAGDDKRLKNGGDASAPEGESEHIQTSVVLQTSGYEHVLEDEKGHLKLWPYSDFDDNDKLPVTLHRAKRGINIPIDKGMSNRPASMTVIQSAERSTEMPENRLVQKYHASSILPVDQSSGEIMKAHGESVQSVLLQDDNGNAVSEEELAAMLPKIADSISKMENSNAEEILPGITQSITKLKNGGNLVITTMTRKLDEDESGSSGRGSPEPEHPVLNVDDLEKSKIFLVQDSKGELFYVEDVTSETQESAYFSSRNTSESISEPGNSPTFDRISKIQTIGRSGIKDSTAQEILSNMYGDSDVKEITENEEEWSERTYEYDLPRRKDYSKDSFKTSYMVEEPGDTLPKLKTATTTDKYESSYKMSGGSPMVYDGGMSQSYSQVTKGVYADDTNSVSAVSLPNAVSPPVKTIERYTIEGEATDYPIVPMPPQPLYIPPPPMVVQTDTPQLSLVKVDVTPRRKNEGVQAKIEAPKPVEPEERPIYKTVATFHTPDKLPAPLPPPQEQKKYKIISSKATEEEEQESHMRFDEIDYKFSSENIEYKMRPATTETQFFVRNTTKLEAPKSFRSEKRIELGRQSDQKFKSEIKVQETKPEVYEQSSYSYDQMRSELQQSESNMRVVRGSYLIKNTLDDVDGDLDDNINMFDGNFTMCKDNPLYKSDEDIYQKIEKEKIEKNRIEEMLKTKFNHDITFETIDKIAKSKAVKREPRKKVSLYEILMNRLSTIDKKHIRQNFDVKHHSEDIYGDPRFLQADGQYLRNVEKTNDFDTVGEKVDLMLKAGKAVITIKVTAERITPVDLDFNVWRKNQAIVTRTIEVDLLATEKRRRLYYKVMESTGGSHEDHRAGPNETILDSEQTLDLFTKILGAADGEGDVEDIEVRTRAGRTTCPHPGMDLLY